MTVTCPPPDRLQPSFLGVISVIFFGSRKHGSHAECPSAKGRWRVASHRRENHTPNLAQTSGKHRCSPSPQHHGDPVRQGTRSGVSEAFLEGKASSTLEAEQCTRSCSLLWPRPWLRGVSSLTPTLIVGRCFWGVSPVPCPPRSCRPCLPSFLLRRVLCLQPLSPRSGPGVRQAPGGALWNRAGVHCSSTWLWATFPINHGSCTNGVCPWDGRDGGTGGGWGHGRGREAAGVMAETPAPRPQQADMDRTEGPQDLEVQGIRCSGVEPTHG